MPRIKTYTIDDPIDLKDKLIGTESVTDLTKNWELEKVWELFVETGNGVTITLSDEDSSTYDYKGGTTYNGSWIIVRYLKTDVAQREVALNSDPGNSIYGDLDTAWTNRTIVNYN